MCGLFCSQLNHLAQGVYTMASNVAKRLTSASEELRNSGCRVGTEGSCSHRHILGEASRPRGR